MNLAALQDDLFAPLEESLAQMRPGIEMAEVAHVLSVGNGIAEMAGFTDLRAHELLNFSGGVMGIASNLGEHRAGVIVLGETKRLRPGDPVRRTSRVVDVPVGAGLIGRVVDALGRPLDGGSPIDAEQFLPVEQPLPPIMHRAPMQVPQQTGLKAIDAGIPIGRGQRELIHGDRQAGKIAIGVDAILNQHNSAVLSIYCAIGQRASAVARVVQSLREGGAIERTIVVAASGGDAPGLQFMASYAATSMAEHFMGAGRIVLIVYDDLRRAQHRRATGRTAPDLPRPAAGDDHARIAGRRLGL